MSSLRLTTLCENTAGMIGFTGEWGLSILIEYGDDTVLLDTGLTDSLMRNTLAGGFNLSKVNKIVLSHGHTDHTGGLRLLLQMLRKRVEIYAHPDIWEKKYIRVNLPGGGSMHRFIGIPFCREELEALGASFVLNKEPVWLTENIVTTGEVPLTTQFEGVDNNMFVKTDSGFVPDALADDQGIIVKTEKGLVLLLGCAHRGLVNTMLHARNLTGIDDIYAVVGGTHLISAKNDQLNETVAAIKKFGVQKIGVSHCTGLAAAAVLAREFGDKFFFNNAGTVVEL
ncbi:7,8-dihydropterin-6-yl-methyl-4-(beta-D-ribofuranosyl)aminobenzene 5'-phosphate synthase [Desulfotomaculum arcticum]|uniref:7,8-dihydropterin-6-yl-methyl-4-(Beta-D-ribofuranosyl)aminobenzene 5'-phosphate synthase n=1 Tax=Desulfotruncus arcticus DSM 17038 TaxID=1121424 RepID=A0A1I2U2G6_9FIRM|nr:MBL fold metallo-hydrolase [Desulfotruncus arcticus]SFG71254.1 7,8-dihydropterin-6-yl-methyl-4-(beta-D-ribofuranosyl)aminobenzene 5'-phosphate synthase [Desulfotomaculum arcticum] [Desulfotruncus arcticus DSM 17038]